jgi:hypothetical protein
MSADVDMGAAEQSCCTVNMFMILISCLDYHVRVPDYRIRLDKGPKGGLSRRYMVLVTSHGVDGCP